MCRSVSERFHNSQNENDMYYKNSDRMKFSVFAFRRGFWLFVACFDQIVSTSWELFEIIRQETLRNNSVCT